MHSCLGCHAELSESDTRCPQCGRGLVESPRWRLVFKSREKLRDVFDNYLVHHGLLVPRIEPIPADTTVRIQLVLPDDGGELPLTGKVVGTVEQPSRAKMPYDVQLELLDLDAGKEAVLRRVASGEVPAAASEPERAQELAPTGEATPVPENPATRSIARPKCDADEADALMDALIEPWEPAHAPEPSESTPEFAELPPEPANERLPQELARELTDFTLEFARALTKSSYYTADHQEAGKAKLGLYTSFRTLVADRPETTFHVRRIGEKCSILVYGIFDEPTDLAQAMLPGTADLFIPKLSHYFEANGLLSISFKRALTEEEFHEFVDLLAMPPSRAPGTANPIVHRLAERRIHNISVVVVEDRIAGRGLSWRVEMALTRLKKDLSVIPLYKHLSDEELRRVRLQVFRDVLRPLRQVSLIRELLENCDRVVEEVEEFSQDQLADFETQVLACAPEDSLPSLLEGLVDDIANAKRESEEEMDRLLRLTRRVTQRLSPEQAKNLEDAFRVLLKQNALALEDLPVLLQRKFRIEHAANTFLTLKEPLLTRFDRESASETYQRYLDFFESIFLNLLSRSDPSAVLPIVDRISEHRTQPGPFEERPALAAARLERLGHSCLGDEFVRQLSDADKVKRDSLLELPQRLGEGIVPELFTALSKCQNPLAKQALSELLAEFKDATLGCLRHELGRPDPPADYLLELLRILRRVGDAGSAKLAMRFLEHADPAARIEALHAVAALDADLGEERAVTALSDRDPRVQEVALKALFERGSGAPAFFAFCGCILSELDESNQEMACLICSRLAGYEQGEARDQSVALLRIALGVVEQRRGRLWSSLAGFMTGEPEHVSVRIAACQALGHLRATEASAELTHLSKQGNSTLRRAATHALQRIQET